MLSLISSLVLGATALYMFARARFELTRSIAVFPALMAAAEMYFSGVLEPETFPVLTALLVLLRVGMVAFCLGVTRADTARAKRREEHRRRMARQTRCALHGIEPVVVNAVEIRTCDAA